MTINDAVAKRIIKLLKERQMTQYRLEQNSGIAHGAMDRILTRQNKTVTVTTLYRLARGFDMNFFDFLDDDVFRSEEIEID
ncbi:MAG: helix-turn-helix transcriptional regulator [Bacteroides sp.]|nr:helix-turn-helix transcriptional regulator [Bacillota bacterium]MCM1394042.1 helix-turn-helix transcriptional regulator [[Eubacterium] siraeum]MCM1455494.1 helix-turn-helix transcriptional regulator [Bacteroides sp.]